MVKMMNLSFQRENSLSCCTHNKPFLTAESPAGPPSSRPVPAQNSVALLDCCLLLVLTLRGGGQLGGEVLVGCGATSQPCPSVRGFPGLPALHRLSGPWLGLLVDVSKSCLPGLAPLSLSGGLARPAVHACAQLYRLPRPLLRALVDVRFGGAVADGGPD